VATVQVAVHVFVVTDEQLAVLHAVFPDNPVQPDSSVHALVHTPHWHVSDPQSASLVQSESQWVLLSVPPSMVVPAQEGTAVAPNVHSAAKHTPRISCFIMSISSLRRGTHSSDVSNACPT
jgi:hypothetical protein